MTLQEELNYWNELYAQEIQTNPNSAYTNQLNDYRKECLREYNGETIVRTRPSV
jgi:hypothetical protein